MNNNFNIDYFKSFLQQKIPGLSIQSLIEKQGDEHFVVEINHALIFRQAKNTDSQMHMSIEFAFLKALEDKIKCEIPKIDYYFPEMHCLGYKKIAGTPLTEQLYASFTKQEKFNFADDLAQFLYDLHKALPIKDAHKIGLTAADWPLKPAMLHEKYNEATDMELKKIFEQFIPLYENLENSKEYITLIHNDLHADNILINPETKRLSGIIDFTGASVDSIYHEFRYLHLIDLVLVASTVQAYNQKTWQVLSAKDAYIYCMATEFSRLSEALIRNDGAKASAIQSRIVTLTAVAF